MNRTILSAVIPALLVCLGALASGCHDKQDDADVPTIRVGYVGHDHQLALYLAASESASFAGPFGLEMRQRKEREVYDLVENGRILATLQLVKVGGASNMPAAMDRGEIAIGLGGVAPVAKFVDRGSEFRIICPLQTEGDQLVMRSDSPIDTWAGFVNHARTASRPLRIGYKGPVAVAKLVFMKALQAEGIACSHDPADESAKVILVHMVRGPNAIPMLASDDAPIDGFVMNQPVSAKAQQMGIGKVVAQLRDLPPEGAWRNHPCCCVAATADVLEQHPKPVRALLKLIILATRQMQQDPETAARVSTEWTGSPPEVERRSIPTITYVGEFSDEWIKNLATYYEMMQDVGAFKGRYKDTSPAEIVSHVVDRTLCDQAAEQLSRHPQATE